MAEAKQMLDALVRDRQGSGIAATAVLGGVALIAGLALRALVGTTHATASATRSGGGPTPEVPRTPFDHVDVDEDEARIMLRAMVAATMADGLIDDTERNRLYRALEAAGIDAVDRAWLDKEMDEPADVDQLAARLKSPEQAARIFVAARLAIEPDTLQERQFLKMLAEALDVSPEAVARLDRELAG